MGIVVKPTVRECYEPQWARLRAEAIALLTAGDRPGYRYRWRLAQHVRNEMTPPKRTVS